MWWFHPRDGIYVPQVIRKSSRETFSFGGVGENCFIRIHPVAVMQHWHFDVSLIILALPFLSTSPPHPVRQPGPPSMLASFVTNSPSNLYVYIKMLSFQASTKRHVATLFFSHNLLTLISHCNLLVLYVTAWSFVVLLLLFFGSSTALYVLNVLEAFSIHPFMWFSITFFSPWI